MPCFVFDTGGRGDIELFAGRVLLRLPFTRVSVSDVVFLAGAESPRTDERLKAGEDLRPRADAEFFYSTVGLAFLFVDAPDAIDGVFADGKPLGKQPQRREDFYGVGLRLDCGITVGLGAGRGTVVR